MSRSVLGRFVEKVELPADRDGCWRWNGAIKGGRYGEMRAADGSRVGAHVIAYLLAYGAFPADHDVHHTCGNMWCVNPDHLVAMSRSDHKLAHAPTPESEEDYYARLVRLLDD